MHEVFVPDLGLLNIFLYEINSFSNNGEFQSSLCYELAPHVKDWLYNNIDKSKYNYDNPSVSLSSGINIFFDDINDKVLFQMRWL